MVRDKLVKLVETEEQMLFIFHLVGPFLQRLHSDRFMRILFELTVQLYEILLRVDRCVPQMKYMDAVCDLLYHIKYQVWENLSTMSTKLTLHSFSLLVIQLREM